MEMQRIVNEHLMMEDYNELGAGAAGEDNQFDANTDIFGGGNIDGLQGVPPGAAASPLNPLFGEEFFAEEDQHYLLDNAGILQKKAALKRQV